MGGQKPVALTAKEYVERIAGLVATGQDEQALAFSTHYHDQVEPLLSLSELQRVDGLLEGAAMAVSLQRSVTEHQEADIAGLAAASWMAERR
jgi:hypothetical protein